MVSRTPMHRLPDRNLFRLKAEKLLQDENCYSISVVGCSRTLQQNLFPRYPLHFHRRAQPFQLRSLMFSSASSPKLLSPLHLNFSTLRLSFNITSIMIPSHVNTLPQLSSSLSYIPSLGITSPLTTSPPPPHHLHLTTSPPPPHHLHLTTSTSPPPPHHLHLTTTTSPHHLTTSPSPSSVRRPAHGTLSSRQRIDFVRLDEIAVDYWRRGTSRSAARWRFRRPQTPPPRRQNAWSRRRRIRQAVEFHRLRPVVSLRRTLPVARRHFAFGYSRQDQQQIQGVLDQVSPASASNGLLKGHSRRAFYSF